GAATNTLPAGAITTAEGATNALPASATLVRIDTALAIAKSFQPDSIVNGGASTLRIVLTNTDPSALRLTDVSLTDELSAGLVVASPANARFTGAGCSGTALATPGGRVASLTGATVEVGATCTLQLAVRATTSGSFSNLLVAGSVRSAQGVTNPAPA